MKESGVTRATIIREVEEVEEGKKSPFFRNNWRIVKWIKFIFACLCDRYVVYLSYVREIIIVYIILILFTLMTIVGKH